MDIKITLTNEELTRIATAIRGNRGGISDTLTDTQVITAIIEEHLKNWVRSFEGQRDAKTAREAAEQKADTEVLQGKGAVLLEPVIAVDPIVEEVIR